MRIRYELKRSKMLENLLFLSIIRAIFEIVDIEVRRGRFRFDWALGEMTLLFIGVLIVIACAGTTVSEMAGAVGTAGLIFLYFYRALLTGIQMIIDRSAVNVPDLVMYALLSLASALVMMFMFGKVRHRAALLGGYIALALTAVFAIYHLVIYFALDTPLYFVYFAEMCIPAVLIIIMKSSTEK